MDAFVGEADGNINYLQNIGSSNNPAFQSPDIGGCSAPTFADIDSDTDLDAFIGDVYGNISYFKNVGSSNNPVFEKQTGTDNPFDGIDVGTNSAPTFVDTDGDGDLDAFVGESDGNINYFQNIGSSSNPIFVDKSPVNVNIRSAPTFVDIDGDGDLDAFVGDEIGINYFQNIGSSISPNFIKQTGMNDPFDGMNVGFRVKPTFVDIDNDGDFDAFFGEFNGNIFYFQNTGNSTSPVFDTRITNPFGLTGVGDLLSAISFVDIDNDGDLDAFTGENGGNINYFRNTGSDNSPIFVEQTGINNPFDGIDAGTTSVPTFADIDGDGDFDAFIGLFIEGIKYFKNTGSSSSPVFVEQTGINNPLDIGYLSYSTPTFVDIDGDSDLDAFVGEFYGNILYFQNTGNSTSPVLVRQIGINNPFGGIVEGIDVGNNSTPNFVDIDGDSDLDAFIGKQDGTINYFQNTGSSSSGNLVEQTGANNPLSGIDVGDFSAPILVDIDGDGDLDAFIGKQDGTISYFQNTGSSINGILVEQTGTDNPFNGIGIGDSSTPTFVDIDGDGDLDAFIGKRDGTISYFQNNSPIIPVELIVFTGKATKAGNQLLWQTASEINNKGFNVERSEDAKSWETLGFVAGNGTTLETQNYTFLDTRKDVLVKRLFYYRLKQLDFDGRYEYSNIVAVNYESGSTKDKLIVFPNPTSQLLNYQAEDVQQVELFDSFGKLVKTANQINGQLSLEGVSTGVYVLVIQTKASKQRAMIVVE